MIPSEFHDIERSVPDKISIWLFMDISGSCYDFKGKFLRAYSSIPKDKFDIRVFSFDTHAHELHPNSKTGKISIYGGGGTSFRCIERKIQSTVNSEHIKYPKLVLVFTDGEGWDVNPQHPDRWYWFLMGAWSTTEYIPRKSTTHYLKDFV